MRTLSIALAAALLAAPLAASAQEAPRVTNMWSWGQAKSTSMQHWNVIAEDIAQQVVLRVGADTPIYVAHSAASPFEAGLSDFLVTALSRVGMKVVQQPQEGAVAIGLHTMAATHRATADTQFVGKATALTAGVAVLRQAASPLAGALGLAAMIDFGRQFFKDDPQVRSEVAVTTSVMKDGAYVFRSADVYYIDDQDGELYGIPKNVRVEGGR